MKSDAARMVTFALAWLVIVVVAVAQGPGELSATGRVEGRVVDALGAPVPLADVRIEAKGVVVARTRADGDGRFAAGKLVPAAVRIFAEAPEHTTAVGIARLDALHATAFVELQLFDAATVSGVVRDAQGRPVAGARLMATSGDLVRAEPACGTSDAEGRYRLERVALGDATICSVAAGHRLAETALVVGGDAKLDLKLEDGESTTLLVRITGASPEQLASARCSFWASRGRGADHRGVALPPDVREGPPDAQGVWRVEGLPRDLAYDFVSVTLDGATVTPEFQRADAGEALREFQFAVVAPRTATIRGVLVDTDGAPVPRASLRCRGRIGVRATTAVTGDDGSFAIDSPVSPGEVFVLSAGDPALVLRQRKENARDDLHFESEHVAKCAPDESLRIVAAPATELRGRCVDAAGRPVFGAEVTLALPMGEQLPAFDVFDRASTDRDGRFAIRQLDGRRPRDLRLEVESREGTTTIETLRLGDAAISDLGELKLAPPAEIFGVVTDAQGTAVPGARIALGVEQAAGRMRDFVGIGQTLANREGRFRLAPLAPGRYRLTCLRAGEQVTAATPGVDTVVAAGDRTELPLPQRR